MRKRTSSELLVTAWVVEGLLGDLDLRLSVGTGARISAAELLLSTGGAVIVIFGDFSRPSTLRFTSFSSDDRLGVDGDEWEDEEVAVRLVVSRSKLCSRSELFCRLSSCILRYRSASESVL